VHLSATGGAALIQTALPIKRMFQRIKAIRPKAVDKHPTNKLGDCRHLALCREFDSGRERWGRLQLQRGTAASLCHKDRDLLVLSKCRSHEARGIRSPKPPESQNLSGDFPGGGGVPAKSPMEHRLVVKPGYLRG
jgi:hypothetical protein